MYRSYSMFLVISLLMVVSCDSNNDDQIEPVVDTEGGNTSSTSIVDVEIGLAESNGLLPTLQRGRALEGADSNDNGIRDDIDTYLDELPSTQVQRGVLAQYAKTAQKAQMIDLSDEEGVIDLGKDMFSTGICIAATHDDALLAADYISTIDSLTANTPERFDRYALVTEILDGTVYRMQTPLECEG